MTSEIDKRVLAVLEDTEDSLTPQQIHERIEDQNQIGVEAIISSLFRLSLGGDEREVSYENDLTKVAWYRNR